MWDGIFCTFYADSFFMLKIMTSFLGKFDTQKIISHRCQLGDKVCRMKGSHQWVDYNIRVSRKHILCYFHQGCHIPILFLEGGGEFSPLCPWTPERRIRFCRKILDIIDIFRPSQANTFDFAQNNPWHSKEKLGSRLEGRGWVISVALGWFPHAFLQPSLFFHPVELVHDFFHLLKAISSLCIMPNNFHVMFEASTALSHVLQPRTPPANCPFMNWYVYKVFIDVSLFIHVQYISHFFQFWYLLNVFLPIAQNLLKSTNRDWQ